MIGEKIGQYDCMRPHRIALAASLLSGLALTASSYEASAANSHNTLKNLGVPAISFPKDENPPFDPIEGTGGGIEDENPPFDPEFVEGIGNTSKPNEASNPPQKKPTRPKSPKPKPAKPSSQEKGANKANINTGPYKFTPGFGYKLAEMANYNQGDNRWANIGVGFKKGAMKAKGCAPTSLSMVVGTLKDNPRLKPDDVGRQYGPRYFFREGSNGKGNWDGVTQAIARDYGLDRRVLGDYDNRVNHSHFRIAKNIIQDGGMVMALAEPGYFTGRGHFIVLRAYDRGFRIADPNGNQNHTERRAYSADFLIRSGKLLKMWAFIPSSK